MPAKQLSRASLSTQRSEDLRQGLMDGHFKPGKGLTIAAFAEQYEEVPVRQLTGRNHKHFNVIDAMKARGPLAAEHAMHEDVRWNYELVAAQEKAADASRAVT